MPRAPWDTSIDYGVPYSLEERKILDTEFSELFAHYMRNRMMVSFYKYGKVEDAMVPKQEGAVKTIDAIKSAHLRIDKYKATGNVEFLIDAANFMMMEFMYPSSPIAHFQATDSDQSPGRIESSSGEAVPYSNRDLL